MKGKNLTTLLSGLLGVVVVGAGIILTVGYHKLQETALSLSTASSTVATLTEEVGQVRGENTQLKDALEAEKERNDAFQERIDEISGTVGKLDKLARTDPELLQKYSKIYFLNENYIPSALTKIPTEWTFNNKEEYFHQGAWNHLEAMLEDAKDDGVELRIVSAYRAFEKQAQLKSSYLVNYGSGANAFSADQGYSEHQLGTTLDLTTESLGSGWTTSFDDTDGYQWLTENAYKHGFILSYPPDNAFYVYEPWHWRYVGKDLARDLHEDGTSFYDLDQRELDEYLIDFFD